MISGYKEWSLICAALGSGAQSLLLRKGGISEGMGGFRFKRKSFYLLPTLFHQQAEHVSSTLPWEEARTAQGEWIIRYYAEEIQHWLVTDWDQITALEPFHVWKPSLVQERYEYKNSRHLAVALVRIEKFKKPLFLKEQPDWGGCKSWVDAVSANEVSHEREPVISDLAFYEIKSKLESILGAA